MTTPIWLTGFEYGVGTPTANGTGLCDVVTGTPTITTGAKRSGVYGLRINSSAATQSIAKAVSSNIIVIRFYFLMHTEPASAVRIWRFTVAAGADGAIYFDPADNKIYPSLSTAGTKSAVALSLDTWYCIDAKFDCSSGTSTLDVQLDGAAITQKTLTQTATTCNGMYIGFSDAVTGEAYYDDIIASYTALDYPIGAGMVEAISPNADGTHNPGTNVIENNAGVDIGGTVTAYNLLNKVPLNSGTTTYIRQAATGTANYAAVKFGTLSGSVSSINGAIVVLAYQSATTTANSASTRLYDGSGGTLLSTIYTGDMSETSLFYKAVIGTAPAGGWGTASLGTALVRVGYASDANPNPYWNSLIIEYDYVPAASGPSIGTVTPGEATQSQSVDAALINAFYNIIGGEATQAQLSDGAVISIPPLQIAPAESTQSQLSDAAITRAFYLIAPAENTQAQTSDAAIARPIYPVIPEDYFQNNTSDAAVLSFIQPITAAENTQSQASDPAVLSAKYPVIVAEASQTQTSDAAGVTFGVMLQIAPGEATQAQGSDSINARPIYPLIVSEGMQGQSSDSAIVSILIPGAVTINPGQSTQSQASDVATLNSITVIQATEATQNQLSDPAIIAPVVGVITIAPAQSLQAQISDAVTVSILVAAMVVYPGSRTAHATGTRGTEATGTHGVYPTGNRETIQVEKINIHSVNIRKRK